MPEYRFVAKSPRGREVKGLLFGNTEAEAREWLQSREYQVVQLTPVSTAYTWLETHLNKLRPLDLSELALTTRQMTTMVQSGLGIVRALEVVREQPLGGRLQRAWNDVTSQVHKGNSLARSMGRHPDVFDALYLGLVRAGEASGALAMNLARLADLLEKDLRVRRRLAAALTYPAIVFVVCILCTLLLTQQVLPSFVNGIFRDSSMSLPLMTRSVIMVTDLLNHRFFYWTIVPSGLVALYFLRAYLKTPGGKRRLQQVVFHTPLIRQVLVKVASSRFSRTMSSLLQSGVPMMYSLELSDRVLGNYLYSAHMAGIRAGVEQGEKLSSLLRKIELFPPSLAGFVELGEESGRMPELLDKLADIYDEEMEIALETCLAALEPLMVGVMGLLVGYIVVAMFLPLYSLLNAI